MNRHSLAAAKMCTNPLTKICSGDPGDFSTSMQCEGTFEACLKLGLKATLGNSPHACVRDIPKARRSRGPTRAGVHGVVWQHDGFSALNWWNVIRRQTRLL